MPQIDHFALQASDAVATRARLEAAGVPFREATYAQLDVHQIVVHDPDGVKVENGRIRMPELPGIGFEGKSDLIKVMRELAE